MAEIIPLWRTAVLKWDAFIHLAFFSLRRYEAHGVTGNPLLPSLLRIKRRHVGSDQPKIASLGDWLCLSGA
jgi:hypothetical protein